MPIFSAFISTLFLLGRALTLHDELPIWNTLTGYDQFWMIFATIAAVTAALSGWFYVGTRRLPAGRVHGLIMAAIGCFGLRESLESLTSHSVSGARGPDINPMGGLDRIFGFLGVVFSAVVLLCGVLVIWNTFNASRRNHNGA
ncbi:MAG: hypothetical protein WCK55_21030 [Verrucomicrobiota bacterium]